MNLNEEFRKVEPMLKWASHNFIKKYGGDYDDMFSEAQWFFLKAANTYDPNKGTKFSTWVWNNVRSGFTDFLRKRSRRPQVALVADPVSPHSEPFPLWELLEGISDGAKEIVSLFYNPPSDVSFDVNERTKGKLEHEKWDVAITEFLKDTGWSAYEIVKSYDEIRKVLADG